MPDIDKVGHIDPIREAITKKNGQTWEKVQTSFTPSLPPSTWEPLTVIFLLHIWALGTLKRILRATYFFLHKSGLTLRLFWGIVPYVSTSELSLF